MLALAALAPLASAASAPSTTVVSATIAGPNAANSEGDVTVACPSGLVSGGGTRTQQGVLSSDVHVIGSFPSAGGAQSADQSLSPSAWSAAGGVGGQTVADVSTTAYGMCLGAGLAATKVVVASAPGPSVSFSRVLATATCPAATRLLGGGARTTPGTVGSLKPIGSYPSDAAGTPILSGSDPASWTAAALNGGSGDAGNTTYAFAICATAGADNPTVTVSHARVDGPNASRSVVQATTTCTGGAALLGGGGYVSDGFALPGSQGDHLTASFPSDPTGIPVTAGVAGSWTATSSAGGAASGPLTGTDVWALCATAAAAAAGPPLATTGPTTAISDTGAGVAGTVDPGAAGAAYVFEYGPSLSFGSITAPTAVDAGAGATAVSSSLTGLTPNTTYYYRLVATNGAGTSFGTVRSLRTTGPAQPPLAITQPATSITDTSATLSGLVDPNAQQTAYTFEYGTSTSFGAISTVVGLDDADGLEPASATLGVLSPATTYLYRVVATNATGTSSGDVRAFTTAPRPAS